MSKFGKLLRFYRQQCADGGREERPLTQERLGELLGTALGGTGYSGAAVSDWERSKSKIDKDQRLVLVNLLKVLQECGGLRTPVEADTLLRAGNYRPLDKDEQRQVFPASSGRKPSEPGNQWRLVVMLLTDLIFRPGEALRELAPNTGEGPPHWPGALIGILGQPFRGWSSERVLRAVFWLAVWLLVWTFTFPLLHWPFADQEQAWVIALIYMGSAFALPLLMGGLMCTEGDAFWQQQGLATTRVLRLFTHMGAMVGFHVGYMTILAAALLGYYLNLGASPRWLEGLTAAWPVILGYAAARQVPFNLWRAFGNLRFTEGDGALLAAFALFGPLWGAFFYAFSSMLLSAPVGPTLILSAIGGLAGLTVWQRRAGKAVIPAPIWALIFGIVLVLQQATTTGGVFNTTVFGGLVVVVLLARERIKATLVGGMGLLIVSGLLWLCLSLNVWVGRVATVAAIFAWWRWGKYYIWFPAGFWGVLAAAAGGAWLISQWAWSEVQASTVFSLIAAAILWLEGRRRR